MIRVFVYRVTGDRDQFDEAVVSDPSWDRVSLEVYKGGEFYEYGGLARGIDAWCAKHGLGYVSRVVDLDVGKGTADWKKADCVF